MNASGFGFRTFDGDLPEGTVTLPASGQNVSADVYHEVLDSPGLKDFCKGVDGITLGNARQIDIEVRSGFL